MEGEQPQVQGREGGEDQGHHGRPVKPRQRPRDTRDLPLGENDPVALEDQQEIGARSGNALLVLLAGRDGQAEGLELVLHQILDIVRADLASEAATDPVGDGHRVAHTVDGLGDEVEQPGQLDHLPVRPADQILTLPRT